MSASHVTNAICADRPNGFACNDLFYGPDTDGPVYGTGESTVLTNAYTINKNSNGRWLEYTLTNVGTTNIQIQEIRFRSMTWNPSEN